MAKKGTFSGMFYYQAGGGGYYNELSSATNPLFTVIYEWEAQQDVVNNVSNISWKVTLDCSKTALNGSVKQGVSYFKFTTNSVYKYVSARYSNSSAYNTPDMRSSADYIYTDNIPAGSVVEIARGSFTAEHNSDGTKTLYSFTVAVGGLEAYSADGTKVIDASSYTVAQVGPYIGGLTSNGERHIVLDPITTHAIITSFPESFTDESSPTIQYAVPKKITSVTAGIVFGTNNSIQIGRSISATGSSYTFNFTSAELSRIWDLLKQGIDNTTAKFYISSNGVTEYYLSNFSIDNYRPTLDPVVYDANQDVIDRLTGNPYILVRHVSDAYWKTGAQAHKGANINTQSVKVGGKTYYGASGTIEAVPDNRFIFTVVDDAGRSDSREYPIPDSNWIKYIKLTCSAEVTEMTGDGDVKVTLKGKYFDGHFGKKVNTLRMHYDIEENNEPFDHKDEGYISPIVDDEGNYTYDFTIPGLNYTSIYKLTVRVSDEVSVEPTEAQTIIASTPIFDWGRTDFAFYVPVTIQGGSVPTIQAQGTSGIWTYRTWSDGTAECWGKKDVSVTFPSSANWGGLYTTGAISASNISFPFGLFAETPVVNASLLIRSAGGILMAPGGAGSNIASMDQTGVYEIARGASVSGTQYYTINYQVIGKWK